MAGASAGPDFDPRYDARYQRGWAPGESDGSGPDDPVVSGVPEADRTVAPAVPVAPSPRVDPPVDPPVGPPPGPDSGGTPEPGEVAAEPEPGLDPAPEPPAPPIPGTDPAAERDAARIIRVALAIAWTIAGAATLLGVALVWSLVSLDDPFDVPSGEADFLIRTLAQFVAPSLLSTGLLGIVALLVLDGLRRARRIGSPPGGEDRPS